MVGYDDADDHVDDALKHERNKDNEMKRISRLENNG